MGEATEIAGTFRKSDTAGLAVAIVLHAALAGLLLVQINFRSDPPNLGGESMTVSLASEVSLESTAPDPVSDARASTAPTLGEDAPSEPESEADPRREDTPVPTPRSSDRPRSVPNSQPSSRPSSTPRSNPRTNPGSSRFDDAFSEGTGDNTESTDTRIPASQIGASAKASLRREIDRQIKPHWRGMVPQGVDSEKLISLVSFRLAENGALQGTPTCRTKPSSMTPSNRPQAGTHCERAVRAVQLAAPFNLPDRLYNGWKSIRNWEMQKQ